MNATQTFIYLTACAVTDTAPVLEQTDFDALWDMAQMHNMTALTAKTLQGTEVFRNASQEEKKRWNDRLNGSIKKTMLFNAERKKLFNFLEEHKIWYMPLKGAIINGLYPFGTREFADNDILFDEAFRDEVNDFMLGRGYSRGDIENADDNYHKEPFFNFEMHRMLFFDRDTPASFIEYYKDVKDRLIRDSEDGYGYHFSDDDFYIYFIVHLYKHYTTCGSGFRSVADEYMILNCGRYDLDFAHIGAELEKTGARAFEETLRSMTQKVFSKPESIEQSLGELTPDEKEMLTYFLSSGTFGSKDNRILNALDSASQGKRPSKVKYALKRIFPDPVRFKYSHPFVYKHKIVYPFFLMGRLIVNPIRHRKALKREWEVVNQAGKQDK